MQPPDTPKTLLRALSKDSGDEPLWTRLAQLYAPLIHAWLRLRGLRDDVAEEETQTALIRLVKSLRGNPYDPARARFRTYLAPIVASVAYDRLRADRAREARTVPLASIPCDALPNPAIAEPWHMVDAQFRMAALEAALETLRREAAANPLHRAVLEACVVGDVRPVALARRLGVRPNSVAQARRRLLARLRALANLWE